MTLRAHESYGQRGLTPVDRLGVWLSQRAIHRHLPRRNDLEVLELGCGYRATQLIASVVERWIRENPEQWLWFHRRWR